MTSSREGQLFLRALKRTQKHSGDDLDLAAFLSPARRTQTFKQSN